MQTAVFEAGYDASTWKSPVRSNNGVVQGLQVKARQKIMSDRLYALVGKSVQAVIKLSCAYFTPERCGLSFEIIDVLCKDGFNLKKNGSLISSNPQSITTMKNCLFLQMM